MTELPTGTVTFLFSDIEGSTLLLTRLGERFPKVLARHSDIVRRAIADTDGIEVSTEGDSFFLVFRSAAQAVAAATRIQQELHAERWPEDGGVRVRIGLHTGEVELRDTGVGGIAVHIAQRVMAAAEPGRILVSRTVKDLVAGSGIEFVDRGEHDLKGVPDRWRLYGVRGSGSPGRAPTKTVRQPEPGPHP